MTPSDRFQKVVPKGGSALSAGTVEPPLALTDVSLRHGGAVTEVAGSDSSGLVPEAGTVQRQVDGRALPSPRWTAGGHSEPVARRSAEAANQDGRGWVESLEPAFPLTGRLPIRGFFSSALNFGPTGGFCAEMGFSQVCARAHRDRPESRAASASDGVFIQKHDPRNRALNGGAAQQAPRNTHPKELP